MFVLSPPPEPRWAKSDVACGPSVAVQAQHDSGSSTPASSFIRFQNERAHAPAPASRPDPEWRLMRFAHCHRGSIHEAGLTGPSGREHTFE